MYQNGIVTGMDFRSYFDDFKEEFNNNDLVIKYLVQNGKDNFIKFSIEFWSNPIVRADELKQKYDIDWRISFVDILKAYYSDEYIEFLEMIYSGKYPLDEIAIRFLLPESKIEQLVVQAPFKIKDNFCPKCFSNVFKVEADVKDIIKGDYNYICDNCYATLEYDDFLSANGVNEKQEKIKREKIEFKETISEVKSILENISCPNCNGDLNLQISSTDHAYYICCNKCSYMKNDINQTLKDYNESKKKKEMSKTILLKEKQMIKGLLDNKNSKEINFVKDDIIKTSECIEAINFIYSISKLDALKKWDKLLLQVKKCTRLEKIMLVDILQFIKEYDDKQIFSIEGNELLLMEYSSSKPIVFEIIERTKIVIARQIIKKLINNKLLIVDEEQNTIIVVPELVENIDIIKNLLSSQYIDNSLRYSVMQRQNFTCTACGEKGKSLKIAYLSSDKNTNDLNNLIVLCEDCFEVMTNNEVLIQASILNENDYLTNTDNVILRFTKGYFPQLSNSETLKQTIERWEREYKTEDIIKALAKTIYKIQNQRIEKSLNTLLNYTSGLLLNSVENNEKIIVSDRIYSELFLEEWLSY